MLVGKAAVPPVVVGACTRRGSDRIHYYNSSDHTIIHLFSLELISFDK